MAESPFRPGQFVWCRFPFSEAPDNPGARQHVGYVLDIIHRNETLFVVAAVYTTTVPWPTGMRLPLGVIPVGDKHAQAASQKPFVIDARRIAFMPVTDGFFPALHEADRGIQGEATQDLKRRIERTVVELLKRPELLEFLGPDRPANKARAKRSLRREK